MDNAHQQLDQIGAEVRACQKCPLALLRTGAVPGEGPSDAEILFIGEGPGRHEDQQGRPFVGRSGDMLEALLGRIGLTRTQVYITNVVKCRPPNNRDPLPREIEACQPYLDRQIQLLDPLLIVTLGRFSMARFFPPTARITRVHGQALSLDDRVIVPMFHPAAALRNPQWRREMQADFDRLPALLETARQTRAAQRAVDPDFEQMDLF